MQNGIFSYFNGSFKDEWPFTILWDKQRGGLEVEGICTIEYAKIRIGKKSSTNFQDLSLAIQGHFIPSLNYICADTLCNF